MKKPLLIWVSVLTLLGVSATLFAQTTTGSSVITQMKAGVRAFNANLLTELNGNDATPSDYDSSPLIGKETGDMLTAGEWNRVLELVAQGGGSGSTPPIICEKNFSVSAINKTGVTFVAADCWGTLPDNTYIWVLSKYGVPGGEFHPNVINAGETVEGYAGPGFFVWSVTATAGNGYVRIAYIKKTGAVGGGSTGSNWVDVPLTDTADYDVSCQYRLTMSFADDVNRKWHNATSATYYISWMSSKYLWLGLYNADQNYYGIPSTTKSQYGYRSPTGVFSQSSNVTVTKLEKKC